MACPAGYTEKDLHLLEKGDIHHHELPKAINELRRVCEPKILQTEIMPEPVMFLASQYSILLQWLKYGLARGSLEHSEFASRVLRRLVNTTRYLNSVVYGDPTERASFRKVIHGYHAAVRAEADSQGGAYYADDPELHRWTAATLFVGFSDVYELVWGPMSHAKKTQMMRECAVFGTGLRMPPEMWFDNLEDFYKYFNGELATLEVTYWAKELGQMLMYPKLPIVMYPFSWPFTYYMRIMTYALLPPKVRLAYGFKYGKKKRIMHEMFLQPTVAICRLTPRFIRHQFIKPGVWDMKRSSKRIEKTGHW